MSDHGWFAESGGSLSWKPVAELIPAGAEIVIEIAAAGVNRPDLLQRAGVYPPPPGASEVLGLEVSGTVRRTGPDVIRFKEGDRVMALVPGGGYATACLADEGSVLPVPAGLSDAEAAAFPETAFTVFANVMEAGKLSEGETLFVHGATSGIGSMAVAVATALGHPIYGTAGTDEKTMAAEADGYTRVWNYKNDDWSAAMQDEGGCDVVLDMVGGDYVPRNLAMLREGGRHVSIAFQGGVEATINVMDIMRRRLVLTGSTLRGRPAPEKARLRSAIEEAWVPLLKDGQLKPKVTMERPMDAVEEVHEAMRDGSLLGKGVLIGAKA
jgi:putative PIG3 family NAD(P)H quinone oxidoreductase